MCADHRTAPHRTAPHPQPPCGVAGCSVVVYSLPSLFSGFLVVVCLSVYSLPLSFQVFMFGCVRTRVCVGVLSHCRYCGCRCRCRYRVVAVVCGLLSSSHPTRSTTT